VRCGRGAGPDDEPEPGVFQRIEIRGREHARVGDHDEVGNGMTVAERAEHREQGAGLCLVSLERVHLQREPARVHEQTDEDLRVHPTFL
jgi:hypothetical protein